MRKFALLFSDTPPLWLRTAVIVLLVFGAYTSGINNGFVWDDQTFIIENDFVRDISRWPQYFSEPKSVSADPVLSRMYRPVQTLSFAVDYAIWKDRPAGFHLTSVLLHLAACLLVLFAFSPLTGIRPALIAACIFSVHPALSEGVLSLASRGNQLYTVFLLLSIGFFLRSGRPFDRNHVYSFLAATLAFFSKEQAISYPLMLPLIQAVFGRPWKLRSRQSFLLYAPYLAVAALFLAVRSAVVGSEAVMNYWGGSLTATLLMQAKVFVLYLRLLIWPFYLKGRYTIAGPDAWAAAAVVAHVILIAGAIAAWRRGASGKLCALALAWFYVSLAPVSNLVPIPGSMMGERFIYFTFAGVIPLLVAAGNLAFRWPLRAILPAAAIILVLFVSMDVSRAAVWKSNGEYFDVLSKQEPDNPVVKIMAAMCDLEAGRATVAVSRLEGVSLSAPLASDKAKYHYWYGRSLLMADRPFEAYAQLSKAASLSPALNPDLALLLAESAARSNRPDEALSVLKQQLTSAPLEDSLWNGLGNVYAASGNAREAVRCYKKALELNPKNNEAGINLLRIQGQ